MKLYEFLFGLFGKDKEAGKKPGKNSFTAPQFALLRWKAGSEETLILYDTVKIDTINVKADYWQAVAGMITVRPSKQGCLGALQVAYVASSPAPEYKGAGGLMYALASKVFGAPLTSDREQSTSKDGQQNWDKMISTGKMKRVKPLDNFVDTPKGREYVKVNPDRTHQTLKGPQTATPEDDCKLAGKAGIDVAKAVGLTGTFDTWKTAVSVDAAALLARHVEFEVNSGIHDKDLDAAATTLFMKRYRG